MPNLAMAYIPIDSNLRVVWQPSYVSGSGQGMPAGWWRDSSAPIVHKDKSVHGFCTSIISNDLELLQIDAEPEGTTSISPQCCI